MSAPIRAVAFDLDGTLVDSAAGVAQALNTALAAAGLAGFERPTVRGWIGDGPDALIRRALRALQRDDAGLAARLRRDFDAATLQDPAAQGEPYAGVAALLHALSQSCPLVVVTNKPTPLARAVLKAAGLLGHFAAVHGADTPAQRKPAPLLIEQAARRLDLPAAALLMVGDGPADLLAARAAGCRAAWVSWGYGAAPAGLATDTWRLDAPRELIARLQQPAPIH
ncbi:HAD family hydrolase [Roseateles saccharophilus]|uniref:phosphoglycolate phosphatase n=1 Tax=Roseateles saccharophilus TaxID=304 RepID=A0A4R3UPQ9_ROSSA|nr:HAD-IA family hydrolase [Roseateles saccharophilus]MDG0833304.1 HAD family hydrolase [Roseateles saccharophilus]TCU93755.1 phosphoglycolate phosphatase [Roseateles saccharophilus]